MPHSIALAAAGLDPESGLGVVKAWVESGGDVNGCWDAEDHGGQLNVHRFLRDPEMRGDPLLLMVVYGTTLDYRNEEAVERDCRDRLELIRFLLSVRAAGSWKGYVRTPHKSLVVFRSLLARGRARRRPLWDKPTPHALVRLFDPSLPNGVFWHVLSYWRETD